MYGGAQKPVRADRTTVQARAHDGVTRWHHYNADSGYWSNQSWATATEAQDALDNKETQNG